MLTVEQFKNDYDWLEAWEVATPDKAGVEYTMDNIVEIIAAAEGENDGPNWVALLKMNDGNVVFLDAGCDYTGWGCQASGFRDTNILEHWLGPTGLEPYTRERLFGNK